MAKSSIWSWAARAFFASLGMPTTLAELDVDAADIPKMLPTLAQNKGVPLAPSRS
ncbi:hypothetical protein [Adlercreutzia equolifaciens]|uniref:hypothetical protein n=1 Tax=Adlercreutzia equolifaciens TaxID=446660 RepID=UPI001EDE530D|nr:hypothetical protein [Adlercreutzia equolifaciens]MCG4825603.1 hypothetical protein [Adlercreutzia equolifaciens]MEE0583685.1 hypothetical protein [Adlercreutzia sp.]